MRVNVNIFDDSMFERLRPIAISDAAQLADTDPNAEYLDCEDGVIDHACHFARFTNLKILNISSTPIVSLEGLDDIETLEFLFADFGMFDSIEPIATLPRLRALDVTCNVGGLRDISPLSTNRTLEWLYVADTEIDDISCLFRRTSLRLFSVKNTCVPADQRAAFRRWNPECVVWQ